MTTIDLGEPKLEPLTLHLEQRVTLGALGTEASGALTERIALGRSVCRQLDPATVDAETRPFLEGRPESRFLLLGLTCSFLPVEEQPIEKAWLQIQMRTDSPRGAAEPISWSMEPLSLSDPVQVSTSANLDASLKLTSALVPVEVGPSVSKGSSHTYSERVPYLEALREGTARPVWMFTRTEVTEIRGVHRLRTVIEMPAGATGHAEISVGATLRLKLLGLLPYRSELAEVPEIQTVPLAAGPAA